jgi:uroporphyrinogen-III synthase
VARLRELGADPIEIPAIEVHDPADGGAALTAAVERMRIYDWLVVTSANGATRLLAALRDARDLGGVKVAAIGPGTADALRAGNVVADLIPERFVAEALLDAFPEPPATGGRVLIARAAVARDVLPDGLRAAGWIVVVVDVYRTEAASLTTEQVDAASGADLVTFTSSSTVDRLVEAVGADRVPPLVASIGPVTSATVVGHGLSVDIEATEHTISGLIAALVAHFAAADPGNRGRR